MGGELWHGRFLPSIFYFGIAKNLLGFFCLLSSVIYFFFSFIQKVQEPHGEPLPLTCSENLSSRGHGRFNNENIYSQVNQTVVLLCNIYKYCIVSPSTTEWKICVILTLSNPIYLKATCNKKTKGSQHYSFCFQSRSVVFIKDINMATV